MVWNIGNQSFLLILSLAVFIQIISRLIFVKCYFWNVIVDVRIKPYIWIIMLVRVNIWIIAFEIILYHVIVLFSFQMFPKSLFLLYIKTFKLYNWIFLFAHLFQLLREQYSSFLLLVFDIFLIDFKRMGLRNSSFSSYFYSIIFENCFRWLDILFLSLCHWALFISLY